MTNPSFTLDVLGRRALSGPGGSPVDPVLAQPKRLALLIYLAAASPRGFHRRDTLLALFWPESSDDRGRGALNRAVYFLRRSTCRDLLVTRGDEEVKLDDSLLSCDSVLFERALDTGNTEQALDLYRGNFGEGFHVAGLPEFERWMEAERVRLLDRAFQAALQLTAQFEERHEYPQAARWAHRAGQIAPYDEQAARQFVHLLDRMGDRAEALRFYEQFATRLRTELDLEPSPETTAVAAAVRARRAGRPAEAEAPPEPAVDPPAPTPPSADTPGGSPLRRIAIGTAALLAIGAFTRVLVPDSAPTVRLGKRRIVAAARELELWPVLSGDGRTLFYTVASPTGRELFAQQIDGGSPVSLTGRVPGNQHSAALSPDGTQLLMSGPDGLYIMPALGGQPRRRVIDKIPPQTAGVPRLLSGAWSPDGSRVVYPDRDTLFVQSLTRDQRTPIATDYFIHSPSWSPDGKWIAYVAGNPEFHVRGNIAPGAIRLVRAEGGTVSSVTDSSSFNTSPIWVPGRPALLFISDRDGGRDVYLVRLDRRGLPRAPPVRITTGLNPERIALSADGRRMAWSAFTQTSNIWSLALPVHDSVPLSAARQVSTQTELVEGVGSISTDGAWLYYHSDRSGNPDLWRLPLSGGEAERLTTDPAADFSPAVSPSGEEVAFHSLRTGRRQIYVMPVAGGPVVQVSKGTFESGVPVWSADGAVMAWYSNSAVSIAYRNGDGTWGPPKPLPDTHPTSGMAQWSPDGHWISYPALDGLALVNPATEEHRVLHAGIGVNWHAWQSDGRSIVGMRTTSQGVLQIVSLPLTGARPRLLVYADNPVAQQPKYGLVLRRGQVYFVLNEDKADIWVADVESLDIP